MRASSTLAAIWLLLLSAVTGGRADSADAAKNLCPNGDFERLQDAVARPLPQNWDTFGQGATGRVEMSDDAFQGKRSLRTATTASDRVGANSAIIPIGCGRIRFHYKVLNSSVGGANLALYAIGLAGLGGGEVTRQGLVPPKKHVGDGKWHQGDLNFDFSPKGVGHALIGIRINEGGAIGNGDWLIDAVEVYFAPKGPQLKFANVWSDKPLARQGDDIRFSTWVTNIGDQEAKDFPVRLESSQGVRVDRPIQTIPLLPEGSWRRIDWNIRAESPAAVSLKVAAGLKSSKDDDTAQYKILVIDRSANYSRQQLCTDDAGSCGILEKPTTLQEGNSAPLATIAHKKSSEIKRSPYGICTHLPRAKDYEDPFNPSHLIDDDPETCWSSQQNSSTFPGSPPWVEIDLGRAAAVTQIDLVPYWRNSNFPLGFSVRTCVDGRSWQPVLSVKEHRFDVGGPRRADKIAQCFPLPKPVQARCVRIDFEHLPLSGGNYAEVSEGYKARLSGIEVIDDQHRNVALKSQGAAVRASDVFTGWQNTAKTVTESFDRLFDIGLKWLRVGQWGDQTEWAAVECHKGKFEMESVTDRAIQKCADNGVDLLYGLNYGNEHYSHMSQPWLDIGPIYHEGCPFYKNRGPRTEEERQAFVRYVDFVVRKYKDRVKYWELWNEENGWYPGFEPELYGKLLLAVAKHIKSIAPNAKVMFGGTAAPAPITTEISLREGAARYIDLAAFHPYGIDKPEGGMGTMEQYQGRNLSQTPEQTGWKHVEEVIEGVRKPYVKHGRPDVKVWEDEWGTNVTGLDFTHNPHMGEYGCAKYIIRFYVYSGWLDVPTAWWAFYNMNKSQDWGIIDINDYGFRPMSYALQNVCTVVSDVTPLRARLSVRRPGARSESDQL